MEDRSLMTTVKDLYDKDRRYCPAAYFFVIEALDFTVRALNRATREGAERHVSAKELVEGARTYAIQQFGPMAFTVLTTWGMHATEDFGEIVYNLIAAEKLRKTDTDRKEDFAGGYDFDEAFAKPFRPKGQGKPAKATVAARRKRTQPGAE
jgi:uncharacterized repeat protein (TIGR04138 family)